MNVVLAFHKLERQFVWQIYAECFGQHGQLIEVHDRLQPRNNGHVDASFAATLNESVNLCIVEAHLCDNIVGAHIHFLL